jgi:hypothetical protein
VDAPRLSPRDSEDGAVPANFFVFWSFNQFLELLLSAGMALTCRCYAVRRGLNHLCCKDLNAFRNEMSTRRSSKSCAFPAHSST